MSDVCGINTCGPAGCEETLGGGACSHDPATESRAALKADLREILDKQQAFFSDVSSALRAMHEAALASIQNIR